jgi:hypothetical protein
MPTVDVETVMSWNPCQNYTQEVVSGLFAGRDNLSEQDILALGIPQEDKFWALARNHFVDDRVLRLTACRAARRALALVDPDPRSIAAVATAERYAEGEATAEELNAARAEAWEAWRAAARVARDAVWDAAAAAAWAAAAAAWDAARAALDAARDAARAAARVAVWDARAEAEAAAWDAARAAWAAALGDLCELAGWKK